MRRRTLIALIIGFVVVMLIALLSLIGRGGSNSKQAATSKTASSSSTKPLVGADYQTVQLDNIGQYKQLSTNTVSSLSTSLYARIQDVTDQLESTYRGTVRQGSFTTSYSEYDGGDTPIQVPTYAFLVDIPDAQQTYEVTFSGGSGYPYSILHILCPASNQLIYPAFTCQDGDE